MNCKSGDRAQITGAHPCRGKDGQDCVRSVSGRIIVVTQWFETWGGRCWHYDGPPMVCPLSPTQQCRLVGFFDAELRPLPPETQVRSLDILNDIKLERV